MQPVSDLLNRVWIDDANCQGIDPQVFFPPKGTSNKHYIEARRVCGACTVSGECLAYRLVTTSGHADEGIWGGTTDLERRAVARLLRLDRKPSDLGADWKAFVARVQEALPRARAYRHLPPSDAVWQNAG